MRSTLHFLSSVALFFLLTTGVHLMAQSQPSEAPEGFDKGYLFLGPREEIKSKKIKKDRIIKAFFSKGVVQTENQDSPWYNAACFAHGSVLTDL